MPNIQELPSPDTDEKIRSVILGNGPDAADSYACTVPKPAGVTMKRAVQHAVAEFAVHQEGPIKAQDLWVMFVINKKGRTLYHCSDLSIRPVLQSWISEVLE